MSTPTRVRPGNGLGHPRHAQSVPSSASSRVLVRPLPAPFGVVWEPPTELPDSSVLHGRTEHRTDRYGNVESVWCARCGADVQDYEQGEAIESGADECDLADADI